MTPPQASRAGLDAGPVDEWFEGREVTVQSWHASHLERHRRANGRSSFDSVEKKTAAADRLRAASGIWHPEAGRQADHGWTNAMYGMPYYMPKTAPVGGCRKLTASGSAQRWVSDHPPQRPSLSGEKANEHDMSKWESGCNRIGQRGGSDGVVATKARPSSHSPTLALPHHSWPKNSWPAPLTTIVLLKPWSLRADV